MISNSISKKSYIIAEAGVNHNGDYSTAIKLIKEAAICKADAIKFQIFKADDLSTHKAKMAKYQKENLKKKISQHKMLNSLELNNQDYINLKKYAKKKNIDFIVSVFDENSLNFFEKKLRCKILKIPSGEITNYFLLKKLDLEKYKIILSTGMSNLREIKDALNLISNSNIYDYRNKKISIKNNSKYLRIKKRIYLLHCVSDYPADEKFLNLNCIKTLNNEFGLITGFSDHSSSLFASSISVAIGAKIIEKHFTLNRSMKGPDHSSSLDPSQFNSFVSNIRRTELILGSEIKKIQSCEISNMKSIRKSIVASRDINKFEKITFKKLTAKRPASGISPMKIHKLINKKKNKIIKKNQILK